MSVPSGADTNGYREAHNAQEWRNRAPNAHELIFQGIVSMVIVLMIPWKWVDSLLYSVKKGVRGVSSDFSILGRWLFWENVGVFNLVVGTVLPHRFLLPDHTRKVSGKLAVQAWGMCIKNKHRTYFGHVVAVFAECFDFPDVVVAL